MKKLNILFAFFSLISYLGYTQEIRSLQVRINDLSNNEVIQSDSTEIKSNKIYRNEKPKKVLMIVSFEIDSIDAVDNLELDFGPVDKKKSSSFKVRKLNNMYAFDGQHKAYKYSGSGNENLYVIEIEVDESNIYQDGSVKMIAVSKNSQRSKVKEFKLNSYVKQ